jgi:hypothetical protein
MQIDRELLILGDCVFDLPESRRMSEKNVVRKQRWIIRASDANF